MKGGAESMRRKAFNRNTIRRLLKKEGWIGRDLKKSPGNKKKEEKFLKNFIDNIAGLIQTDPDFKRWVFEKVFLDTEFEKKIVEKLREKG
jgi:hypothetical protein